MTKLKNTLSNYIWMPILLTIGFFGWVCKLDFITVPLLCIYVGLLLIFCDDVRNICPVVFSVPFFINQIEGFIDYIILGVSICFFLIGVIVFLIRQLAIKKTPVKKGKLFWGFVISLIAYLIGGLWNYFNLLNFIIIIAMTSASYLIYWLAINFTHNLKTYLNVLFISIGIILSIQLLISYAMVDEPFSSAILAKNVIWIGLQNINVVAIYFILAMISTFHFALKNKCDYLLTLAGMIFAICTYFTYSRMGTLICFILMLICILYIFVKSQNKLIFFFIGILGIFILGIVCIFRFESISKLLSHYTNLGLSGNGRNTLWPWCLDKFIHNPIFGVGFTSKDPVPGLISTDSIILAHNSVIQYLTSLGIVGSLLILYYYIKKYQILLTKFNEFKFMNLLHVLAIGLSGITDQCPTMDIFIICISLVLVANAEKDTEEILKSLDNKDNSLDKTNLDTQKNEQNLQNNTKQNKRNTKNKSTKKSEELNVASK
ncbi:MAG: O-antigen ligase family protein [Christensenellales bacterium]